MSTKRCEVCGELYQSKNPRKTCSEECSRILRERWLAKRRGHPIPAATKKPERHSLSIQEINELAAKHGTTYGKMMAMLIDGKYPEGGKQ